MGEMQRQTHLKMHGYGKAKFTIRAGLPGELRVGVSKGS